MNNLSLFNNFFDDLEDAVCTLPSFSIRKVFQTPKVDLTEGKDSYTLEMDLPGKSEKDIKIELDKNILTISSEKENSVKKDDENAEKEEKSEAAKKDSVKWLLHERSYSDFSRSFTLPNDVDSENLSASVKNGILTVKMPRKALAVPKKIEITCA